MHFLRKYALEIPLTIRPGTTYTSYITGTQTTTLLSSYPITQTQTQIQTFTSSYAITTTAPGKFHQPFPYSIIFFDRSIDNLNWDNISRTQILTLARHHNFEHNHCDNHTPRKHGLYHKYALWNDYHLYFSPNACDHDLHFNGFAGPADNNFGRWNHHYDHGRSHSDTGRRHSNANSGFNGARKHSAGFHNSYYDYSRSQHNNFDVHITERDNHCFGFDDHSIRNNRHDCTCFRDFDNDHTRS
jgi:hypothetical protein